MKRTRFSEEQVIGILREQESGERTADVCRRHGVSSATFYKWKAKYGGMDGEAEQAAFQWKDAPPNEARRLKTLEDENARLKKLLAEAHLDKAMLQEVASGNF